MKPYSKRAILDYASEAYDAIDRAVDSKIWRTNQRIMEIVLAEQGGIQNPYYREPLWFTDILIRRLFTGGLTAAQGSVITTEGERFEESGDEPVLITDLKDQGDDRYAAIFTERLFYSLLLSGLNFDEAREEFFRVFDGRLISLEKYSQERGMFSGSLFYRRVDDPHTPQNVSPPPSVPVGIA